MARVAEVERAAEDLPWIVPHFGAVVSDLSVFHRIDDVDGIGMARFVALLEHLHAYGGAYALSLHRQPLGTQVLAHASNNSSTPDGDTPDEVVAAMWDAVLQREFPDHYAQGVETVSAEEMVRMMSGGG